MSKLEEADRFMRQSGACSSWFDGAPHEVRAVAGSSNGRLLKALLKATDYEDVEAADLLRVGACMVGSLSPSGLGVPVEPALPKSAEELRKGCVDHNRALLRQLREDEHSAWLLETTREDAKRGRMSWPVPLDGVDLEKVLLHPRFVVARIKADGSLKLRAVDHFSWCPSGTKECSVNGHTVAAERFSHDTLDLLGEGHWRPAVSVQGGRGRSLSPDPHPARARMAVWRRAHL